MISHAIKKRDDLPDNILEQLAVIVFSADLKYAAEYIRSISLINVGHLHPTYYFIQLVLMFLNNC